MVTMEDHVRIGLCRFPTPRRRYETRAWVCPTCHQTYVTTRTPNPRLAPDGLSWRWVLVRPEVGPGATAMGSR